MNHLILELAVFTRNWKKILELWPNANIKESPLPLQLRYIHEKINEKAGMLIYLLDMTDEKIKDRLDIIVPYVPFCMMFVDEIDESLENDMEAYLAQFETPLFLVLPEDKNLKETITQISHLDYKLPEIVVLEQEADPGRAMKKLIHKILEKLNQEPDVQIINPSTEEEPL
ncbi:hypothetical protein [Caldithrix abyssi]